PASGSRMTTWERLRRSDSGIKTERPDCSAAELDFVDSTSSVAREPSSATPQYRQLLRVGGLARAQPGHSIISDGVNARRSFGAESEDGVSLSAVTCLAANYTISIAGLIAHLTTDATQGHPRTDSKT